MNELDHSPKLRQAMEEIKDVLKKHDIAGLVMLHTPPRHSEYLMHIVPSYSCAKFELKENGAIEGVRITAKEAETGREKRDQMVHDTVNMLHHFVGHLSKMFMILEPPYQMLKDRFDITFDR